MSRQENMLRNCFSLRIHAGVLQLTLGISLIISVLCSSIILVAYYHRLQFLSKSIQLKLSDNTKSGLQYCLSKRTELEFNHEYAIDLFGEEVDSVSLYRKPWGIFEFFNVMAHQGSHRHERLAMITALPDSIGNAAIYVPDGGSSLYLVGNTKITGTVFLSPKKFSSGFIAGKDFSGKRFSEGAVRPSNRTMPLLDTLLLSAIKELRRKETNSYRVEPVDNLLAYHHSFTHPAARYYHSEQSIELDDSLSGYTIVHSDMKVSVSSRAKLKDVILIAPRIDLEDDFTGSVQCFASEALVVGKRSRLQYPSALVLLADEQERDSVVVIRQDAWVDGVVIVTGYNAMLPSMAQFTLEKGATLHGMAYVNAASDIRGNVYGNVVTHLFQVKVDGMSYVNHLLDATINANRKSEAMPATLLWSNRNEYVVAKWIE